MAQPNDKPAPAAGLADSEDLFNFDEIVASNAKTGGSEAVDVDALLRALEEDPHASKPAAATAPAEAAQAEPVAAPAAAHAHAPTGSAAAVPPAASAHAPAAPRADELAPQAPRALPALVGAQPQFVIAAAPGGGALPRPLWIGGLVVIGALLAMNAAIVWVSISNSASNRAMVQRLETLSTLAQHSPVAHAQPIEPEPEPEVGQPATALHSAPATSAKPALPPAAQDPDPRREQVFGEIDTLAQKRQFGAARRRLYELLATLDHLRGSAREDVESRAAYLLADLQRAEGLDRLARKNGEQP